MSEIDQEIPEIPEVADLESQELQESQESQESQENEWPLRTGLTEETLCAAIETLIFMSERPLSVTKIKQLLDPLMPLRVIHEAIGRLQKSYETPLHGLRLVEVAQGYQFRTRPTYASYVQKCFKVSSLVLAPTALEVLAIIAYRGPLTRGQVDAIRGTDSSHIIRALVEKHLIRVGKRALDEIGKQALYETTPEFLEIFGLASLAELPPESELALLAQDPPPMGLEEIREQMQGQNIAQFEEDEVKELEELDLRLKTIKTDTFLTQRLKADSAELEGAVKKSAFEILEECLVRDEVRRENIKASESSATIQELHSTLFDLPLMIPPTTPPSLEEFSALQ